MARHIDRRGDWFFYDLGAGVQEVIACEIDGVSADLDDHQLHHTTDGRTFLILPLPDRASDFPELTSVTVKLAK